jgi:hypothetical protein
MDAASRLYVRSDGISSPWQVALATTWQSHPWPQRLLLLLLLLLPPPFPSAVLLLLLCCVRHHG